MVKTHDELKRIRVADLGVESHQRRQSALERPALFLLHPDGQALVLLGLGQGGQVLDAEGDRRLATHNLQRLAETGDVKRGPQDGVPFRQALDGLGQPGSVESGPNPVAEHVVINGRGWVQFIPEKHAQLQRGNRVSVFRVRRQPGSIFRRQEAKWLGCWRSRAECLVPGTGRKLRNRGALKNLFEGQVETSPLCAGKNGNASDRIASQVEEIVVDPDLINLQHFTPDPRECFFPLIPWPGIGRVQLRAGPARTRQGAAIHLSVGGERQRIEE